jgi:hypothetical protein
VLSSHLTALVDLFNKGKTDLPDGVIHRDCAFRLNGRAYHDSLGRPPSDPLVRLIGCGPAGYRFVLAALRYGIPRAQVAVHRAGMTELDTRHGASVLIARATLLGSLRGASDPFRAECQIELHADTRGHVREIAVTMGDADVELIRTARSV